MRLIDADVLKEDLTRFYDGEVVARRLIDEQPTVDTVLVERIEELEQLDYELYCRTGKSHLNEQQWEWLKGVLKNETD